MLSGDKTQTVTMRIQVPTFSPKVAAQDYVPKIIEAVEAIGVPEGTFKLQVRGLTVGSSR